VGIPSYRLPRDVLDREIEYIEKSGVEIQTSVSLGADRTIDNLLGEGFEAVFLAIGGHKSRKLNVEGESLQGIVDATDFLRKANLESKFKMGRDVIVIGGGNVALDCARMARRLGNGRVKVVCLESREEMPSHEWEIQQALDEGIELYPSLGPKRLLGDGEKVTGVETLNVKSVFDDMGRFNPTFHPDTESPMECDMVILAIGQFPDFSFLKEEDGVELTRRGTVKVDPESLKTSRAGVFAGGEAASGPGMAIEAIAMGRNAAISIDRYLSGETVRVEDWQPVRDSKTEEGFTVPEDIDKAARENPGHIPAEKRVKNFDEFEFGLTEEMAKREAERCLSCGVCCECMECVKACEVLNAIDHEEKKDEVTLDNVGAIVVAVGKNRIPVGGELANVLLQRQGVMTDGELDLLISQWGPTGGRLVTAGNGKKIKDIAYIFDLKPGAAGDSIDTGTILSRISAVIDKSPDVKLHLYNFPSSLEGALEQKLDDTKGIFFDQVEVAGIKKSGTKLRIEIGDGTDSSVGSVHIAVLATLQAPDEHTGKLADVLSIAVDDSMKLVLGNSPIETSTDGIYVCGHAAGSRNTAEAVSQGSAVASLVQERLWNSRKKRSVSIVTPSVGEYGPDRTAVFICECGGSTSEYLDVAGLKAYAEGLPQVAHSNVVSYLCSEEGVRQAVEAIEKEKITRVVTASCSCCSLEQICANCSTQRIRQKERLYAASPLPRSLFEPINIREQCAWAHHKDGGLALEKASELVAMASMRVQELKPAEVAGTALSDGVLVCGAGHDALTCAESLSRKGFGVSLLLDGNGEGQDTTDMISSLRELGTTIYERGRVEEFKGYGGDIYVRFFSGDKEISDKFGSLVLTSGEGPGQIHPVTMPVDTSLKGVFRTPHELVNGDTASLSVMGLALSSRVSAYLADGHVRSLGYVPVMEPFWCRGCGNCAEVCEFGAFELVNDNGFTRSHMKQELCKGCGTCVAYCPTGAIGASHTSTRSLNSMFGFRGDGGFPGSGRIIVFACHWSNFAGVDFYNIGRFQIPPEVRVVRVTCAGRLEESMIIKAFSSGASGVMVMGCGEDICHYRFGNRRGMERMEKAKGLLGLLGVGAHRFSVTSIPPWENGKFENLLRDFADEIREGKDGR
jgi:heterodisulfide reductase subunit A-like polyferredoxin/coenzyme F420-reducing hydrogenase delta subunit